MINYLAIFLVFLSSVIGSFGSIYLKKSSSSFNRDLISQLKNKQFVLGIIIYVLSAAIYLFALRLERVSVLYPITALTHVWVAFLSYKILKERIGKNKVIGITLILIGILVIATQL